MDESVLAELAGDREIKVTIVDLTPDKPPVYEDH
jgi:hypothetical protein